MREAYTCPYCKRPVIMLDKKGVVDGPKVRPAVTRWCTGACDSIIGLFGIFEHILDKGDIKEARRVAKRIKKEVIEILVDRDKSHKEK